MSTTKKIAHNTAIQIAGKAVSTILGLIAIGIMTRYLGVERFGWYITAISFLQFIGILIDFGMTPVTSQMLAEADENKKHRLLQNLIGFRFVTSFVFLVFVPALVLLFPYPAEVKHAVAILTISFLAIAMNQIFVGYNQERLTMHVQAVGDVLGRAVLVVGLWFLVTNRAGFLPVMAAVASGSVAYTLYMWAAAVRATRKNNAGRIRFAFDWPVWRRIITKCWPIAISIVFNVVYMRGDVILLSWFQKFGEVGLYGAAYRVIDILGQTAMMMMGVILPLLAFAWSRGEREKFKQQYQQAFDALMLFAVPVMVGIIILAKPIMILVAGQEFEGAAAPLQILAIAVFGVYFGAVFGHTAVAIDKQKQTMWIYISNAFLSLAGYLYFIPRYGMFGAAWVTVFSELYAGFFLFAVISHYTKHALHWRTLAKFFVSAGVMAAVIYLLPNLHVLSRSVIGAVVYCVMILATRAVSRETLREVFSKNIS